MKKYIIRTAGIRGDRVLWFEAEEDEDLGARAQNTDIQDLINKLLRTNIELAQNLKQADPVS